MWVGARGALVFGLVALAWQTLFAHSLVVTSDLSMSEYDEGRLSFGHRVLFQKSKEHESAPCVRRCDDPLDVSRK